MSDQVPTINVLREARDTISDELRWCRLYNALDEKGLSVPSDSAYAVRFCALGSIAHSVVKAGLYDPESARMRSPNERAETYPGQRTLLDSLDRLARWMFGKNLQHVNDDIGREAAIEVLDAAIAELEK